MKRRQFITLVGGAAVWPVAARTQQAAMPVIGWLSSLSLESVTNLGALSALHEGLGQAGYVDGKNITVEIRFAEGQYDRLPALARDLVARKVAVLLASNNAGALAAKQATSIVPIVFVNVGGDPVKLGLVASLSRPGGNVTGMSILSGTLQVKRLQVLRDLVPAVTTVGILMNPNNANAEVILREIPTAGAALGLKLVITKAGSESDLDAAFATFVEQGARAILVGADPFFAAQGDRLVRLAAHHRLPAIYEGREQVKAGGLMSYGPSTSEAIRQATGYVARILKGEKPAHLPVQQPTKYEMIVNLRTAKALGMEVPTSILLLANEVIE